MVYFEDADRDRDPPRLGLEFRWNRVKKHMEAAVKEVATKRIGRPRP